ncbi:flagellar hook-length control protein FliK [Thalassotalea sp. PLHSN55]|uniref:flagellar hook-length control protein FliK n=1 Tax=Thalassotalea sp. PLHSN55 TaxID=3435888 RepID=UPI003F87F8AC
MLITALPKQANDNATNTKEAVATQPDTETAEQFASSSDYQQVLAEVKQQADTPMASVLAAPVNGLVANEHLANQAPTAQEPTVQGNTAITEQMAIVANSANNSTAVASEQNLSMKGNVKQAQQVGAIGVERANVSLATVNLSVNLAALSTSSAHSYNAVQAQVSSQKSAIGANVQSSLNLPEQVLLKNGFANPGLKAADIAQLSTHSRTFIEPVTSRSEHALTDFSFSERVQTHTGRYEWSAVKLEAQQQNWSKQLVTVLQDRIQMQASQQIKQVNIRLDPPDLGRLEVNIRTEGDRMLVNLSANNSAVRDALLDSSSRLGAGLEQQFSGGVDVNVSDDSLPEQLKESEEEVALSNYQESHHQSAESSTSTGWLNTFA